VSQLRNNPALALMFLNGTGLSDTAAHSVIQREGALQDTLQVFWDNPIVGQGLGGVSSAIGSLHGDVVNSFEESKLFEGMNVFAEILAASGFPGVIPFACFLFLTINKPWNLCRQFPYGQATLIRALVRALVFAWAILQFNQNVLRPYLWVHLAMLCTAYAASRQALTARRERLVSAVPA
jgi:O-antigen ligase